MKTNKPRLFIDFDDTLVDSLSVVVDILNKRQNKNCSSKDVKKWDFRDCYDISRKESEEIFADDEFWNGLSIDPNVINILNRLKKYYDLYIISKGVDANLIKKSDWIIDKLQKQGVPIMFIPLAIGTSKRKVDMSGHSIMIDDNERYLDETNAEVKILYNRHPNREWNSNWSGLKMASWAQIEDFLLTLAKGWNGSIGCVSV